MALELDYMEYSSDALAQAAYVSNDVFAATGGAITYSGGYTIHTFTSGGTFTPNSTGNVEYLIVAGGGGGGQYIGGGAGAGGMLENSSFEVSAGAKTVTVGTGGLGGISGGDPSTNGGDSVFDSVTVIGGGGGGGYDAGYYAPAVGGSGGGGGGGIGQSGAAGTAGQGNAGGNTADSAGGGGGGKGAVGANASTLLGGNGGAGTASSISGGSVTYAGGGGGGTNGGTAGTGGTGGGGNGTNTNATGGAGSSNTGGGGGGSGGSTGGIGGAGGSGIVIIRYPTTPNLQCYSESIIKTQGSYALKGSALITASLNDTLTRTVSPTINLSGYAQIKFDIRASRTGSNIKIGIHDSGGVTTEITSNITPADTFQTVEWDISGVADANKDVIDSIIITIVNADAANTFYIDNMYGMESVFIPQIIMF